MPEVLDKQTIKAISADARQEIMKMLAKRPYTASELAKITRKHVTTVTEHLEVLGKSDLIRKKESSNKWVYYELTDKGEHLFKPQFYSWVVVFSLSIVFVFVGFLRLFRFDSAAKMPDAGRSEVLQTTSTANIPVVYSAPMDYIAYVLIALGILGFAYLIYRKYKK